MKSRTTRCNVWRRVMTSFTVRSSPSVITTPARRAMKFAFTIVTLATNSGVHCSGVHFHLLLEWLPGAFSRSSVMPANAVGRGSFGNPAGGGRRWVKFRIVFESAGLFHGEVINAGFVCHKLNHYRAVMSATADSSR